MKIWLLLQDPLHYNNVYFVKRPLEVFLQKRRVLCCDSWAGQRWKDGSNSLYQPLFVYAVFFLQTFLEKTKSMYINSYTGMPLEKITSTVGLNGKMHFTFDLLTVGSSQHSVINLRIKDTVGPIILSLVVLFSEVVIVFVL